MRALLVLAYVVALSACPSAEKDGGIGDLGTGAQPPECERDVQCAAAAAKCCDCPTFAVPTSDPLYHACTLVSCPGTECADNVAAVCSDGACTLVCKPMACSQTCALGFAADTNGCLSCACAEPVVNACHDALDCVEVRADCCGCAHGGADTAVLAVDADTHDTALGCPAEPQCPSVDTCSVEAAPACIQGRCELVAAGPLPPNACGRADLAACPSGQICLVNADPTADILGVGVCATP